MQQEVQLPHLAREKESLDFITPILDAINSGVAEFGYYYNFQQKICVEIWKKRHQCIEVLIKTKAFDKLQCVKPLEIEKIY